MSKYKEQLGHRTPAELDEMYASVDIHGTGQVDFLTFAEMRVRKKNHTAVQAAQTGAPDDKKKKGPALKTWQSTPDAGMENKGFLAQQMGKVMSMCCVTNARE